MDKVWFIEMGEIEMGNEQRISIELVSGSESEYIIRDQLGITIGRAFIIQLSQKNRSCILRIKFYRFGKESYSNLKDTLNLFILSLFNNAYINKINIIIDEEINARAFVDLGFQLEGMLTDNILLNNVYRDELIFGLDYDTYKKNNRDRDLIINGKRIYLKLLKPEDTEDLLNYYKSNREHLKAFEPARDESFYTLEVQKRSLIESYKQFLNGVSINLGIYKESKLIGKIQISNIIIGIFKNAFVGYSIDQYEQGKGYMKEALNMVLEYASNEVGLHRIEASTLVDNIASQKVLSGCGFKRIGISEKYLYINGEWRDHIIFYKLNK